MCVVVGLCAIPLLIDLGRADTTYTMEKISLVSSQETWLRVSGHEQLLGDFQTQTGSRWRSWMVPTWNGRDRVLKPPMLVWMNVLAFSGLDPVQATPQQLVLRSRLVAFGFVLLALMCTFRIALRLGGLHTAALAVMVAATNLLILRLGRVATYDAHMLGWVTVAVAAGLWAMDRRRMAAVAGWLVCGLALGGAMLTKNPLAMLFVLFPLIVMLVLIPKRRAGAVGGLLLAVLLAAAVTSPWYWYCLEHVPTAEASWEYEYAARRKADDRRPFWFYLVLFGLIFPWTFWLIGALFQPFLRARGESRRRLLVAWIWMVGIVVILSLFSTKEIRYILPALPAAAILVAQLWSWHGQLARQAKIDAGVNRLRRPHWSMLLLASVGFVPLLAYGNRLTAMLNGVLGRFGLESLELPNFGALPPTLIWSIAALLVLIALWGAHLHRRWKPLSAAAATGVWMILASTVGYASYVRSSHSVYENRSDAMAVRRAVTGHDLVFLYDHDIDTAVPERRRPGRLEPDEEFLFYTGRIIRPITPDALAKAASSTSEPLYVMVRLDEPGISERRMLELNCRSVLDFHDGRKVKGFEGMGCRLYRMDSQGGE